MKHLPDVFLLLIQVLKPLLATSIFSSYVFVLKEMFIVFKVWRLKKDIEVLVNHILKCCFEILLT